MQKLIKRFEGVLKYGIAAILMAVPLYPKFPFINIPGTYVSIRIEDFLMLTLTLVFALYFFKEFPKLIKNRLEGSILVFIFIGLVSLISGIFLTQTVTPLIGLLNWLRRIEYFAPLAMGLLYIRHFGSRDLEFFLKVIMITIFIAFIYGFGQKHFSWPVIITQNEEYAKGVALRWVPGSNLNSTFAGHYDLATFLVFTLPLVIAAFFVFKGFWSKVLSGIVGLGGIWLLTNSISRTSIVSYLLAVTVSLVLLKKWKAIAIIYVVSFAFFLLSGSLLARYSSIFNVVYHKVVGTVKVVTYAADESTLPKRRDQSNLPKKVISILEDRSTSIRLNVEWPRALRAFRKNPILGTGYSSITLATDNDFLRLLGEVGFLGLASFLLILFNLGILMKKILLRFRETDPIESIFIASYIGGILGVLLNSLFIDVFEASKFAIIFFLITGIFVSLVRNKLYAQDN